MSDSQGSGRTTALQPKRGKAKATECLSAEAIRTLIREELAAVRMETQPIPASSNPRTEPLQTHTSECAAKRL